MEYIEEFLKKRGEEGILRSLMPASRRVNGKIWLGERKYIDLSSNDYLGLSSHPRLIAASRKALAEHGASASASRLLSGDLEINHKLEEATAKFKNKESALVFNSGYQANIGIISALCGSEDAIFCDRLSHASIIDGILLSGARIFRFRHNDADHLKALIGRERSKFTNVLIITETIFSMDGDRSDLKAIVDIKERFNCRLMVDEAHATGIYGENGSGIVEEDKLSERVDFIMGTFGKALGSFGAYLAASKSYCDYLVNRCRSFIYSTALPPAVIAASLAGISLVKEEPFRRQGLLKSAEYLRRRLKAKGFDVRGSSQIVPVITGDNSKTVKFAQTLREKGYWVLPIRPPTVPEGEGRLRFSLTFDHGMAVVEKLLDDMSEIVD
ncbi:MAG: 8-amino-7-oxononanoate synthase [Candidatus Omnitrophota bacterium]|nr:8-amino-7-oxononanoate synthase [Candidatus Omnitrophota bacterium]